ncbi:NLR family CARD domain-containing protein 3-like isoform X2 [Myripristis murdjan]|uniref:NLR family CARD domain-containing protein 3-like isoform X2 n=1 Tax=Myripristis murdjan TaxID=586833 RepID=UPI0011763F1C|nr:NLR family CARD domain-containing protein 3-like isoform X2 [Myripristis murdjan]
MVKDKKFSLVGLLNHFFEETKQFVISSYTEYPVLFVFDGLDQFEPHLDFDNSETLTDIRQTASVDVLLTNLIKGNLLPSAQVWITSQPSASERIHPDFVSRVTEIREKPDIVSHRKLKSHLKDQFRCVSEGIDKKGNSALLNEIYTDLYIIEGDTEEVNSQHESRQIQGASFKSLRKETSIKYHDIFKPASGQAKIRTVLTNGVAGIGKTIASQKYMLDWAEGMANHEIYYTFPFSFRELNLRKDEEHSLEGLIHQFFPDMVTSEISNYDRYGILIVLDGLDECRFDLNFKDSPICRDVKESTSLNVLLTNLIQGNLLAKAQIWITSRPATSNRIPATNVDRMTEVRGFNNLQKEEYFRKRFSNKDLAERIISHVKKSRSLYIMCHIPVFCWITATVLEKLVSTNQAGKMPKTLTDMYIRFLLLQCEQGNVKYGRGKGGDRSETSEIPETDGTSDRNSCWNTENKNTILFLAKLAYEELEKGNLVFTVDDLTESGIDITETADYSGLFTKISRDGLYKQKMFCFVHLSIQEFLAAVYVFLKFNNERQNVLTTPASTGEDLPAYDFYKSAVDKALGSKNGDWDLFLRFLLGLSLETNQKPLQQLLIQTENSSEANKKTIEYIKEKIRDESQDADKNINLFHCLNELNDHSLVNEIKESMRSGSRAYEKFTPAQWSALTFVLLTSDEKLDVFDLREYRKSEQVLLGMLPVVKVSTTALLSWCELSEKACAGLASSVLSSCSSNLTELDLSNNDLMDSGVESLCDGLKVVNCRLEILKLSGCQVTEIGCASLASALNFRASKLKQLDLSYNHPGDSGVAKLSALKENPDFSLETLRLDHGGQHRLQPGLKKYCVDLTLDKNTASGRLDVSKGNKSAVKVKEDNLISQVICKQGLKSRCYWEVEWSGTVHIGVTYKEVKKSGQDSGCGPGSSKRYWRLCCSNTKYTAWHETPTSVPAPSQKIALFLDWEGGTLDYYTVSSGKLTHKHTFRAKFTEPLYPSFWFKHGSVSLHPTDLDHEAEGQLKPELKKYGVALTLDENTASEKLVLSEESRKARKVEGERVSYCHQSERFKRTQVICREGLRGRCYWEVEWNGTVGIGVAYKGVERRGWDSGCGMGSNDKSWSLLCSNTENTTWHKTPTSVPAPSQKIALFLDWEGGTLDYYTVSSGKLKHIHTFRAEFTEHLYPGFWFEKGSVFLCPPE